jgi:replicative DNA helicase
MNVVDIKAPNDIEAEMAVLGAIMLDSRKLPDVMSILSATDFYRFAHSIIFTSMKMLYDYGDPIDIVSLNAMLSEDDDISKVGGLAYLMQIGDFVPTTANIMYYTERVKTVANQRQMMEAYIRAAQQAEDGDVDKAKATATDMHGSLGATSVKIRHVADVLESNVDNMESRTDTESQVITTGFDAIDFLIGGWKQRELVILGARPSMGKSALAMQLAVNAARRNYSTLFMSIEMGLDDLVQRLLAMETGINSRRLQTTVLYPSEIASTRGVVKSYKNMPLYLSDDSPCTLQILQNRAMQVKAKCGSLDLVIVDYLQMITTKGGDNRSNELDAVSRGLKALAKELNTTVIALASLNRGVEKRDDKRPIMSDLREAGGIEFDADKICFLYRPMYYSTPDERHDLETEDAEFIVTKNRNGQVGSVKLTFLPNVPKFVNWDCDTL